MILHVVKKGDTVWNLSQQYGVSPERIISDNNIVNPRNLVVGQALLILIPQTVYTVRPGDTLDSVARQFGVSALTLLQYNPGLAASSYLRAGQVITIQFEGEKRRTVSINGYAYPYIRRDVLLQALPSLTTLTLFGYGFTEDGSLIPIDDQALINLAYQYRVAPVMLLSSLTEDGTFSSERAASLLLDQELQDKVLDQVEATMLEKGYLGLDADFEYIDPDYRDAYTQFLKNAAARLHPHGFFLNTDLAPKISSFQRGLLYEAHDYGSIGAVSDTVLLMTYEWGYSFSPPMAVAPINQVRRVVEYAVTQIPVRKIMMGIPNYGYDWPLPFERGITQATSIGNQYAVEIAARNGAEIQYDETAQTPHFEYWGRLRQKHTVWFEDVRSIQAKFDLMDEFQLLGGGYWNLMRPFVQNWAFVSAGYNIRKLVAEEAENLF